MSQLEQALLALGFIVVVFLAGYAARAALGRLRRRRRSRPSGQGRLFYAGRRISIPEDADHGAAMAASGFDGERLETDLQRLSEHVDALRSLYTEQEAMYGAARGDLAKATEGFRTSVEQTQALTKSLTERLDAAQRIQQDFEQMLVRLRKRSKDGGEEAVLPFKVRQQRLTGEHK